MLIIFYDRCGSFFVFPSETVEAARPSLQWLPVSPATAPTTDLPYPWNSHSPMPMGARWTSPTHADRAPADRCASGRWVCCHRHQLVHDARACIAVVRVIASLQLCLPLSRQSTPPHRRYIPPSSSTSLSPLALPASSASSSNTYLVPLRAQYPRPPRRTLHQRVAYAAISMVSTVSIFFNLKILRRQWIK